MHGNEAYKAISLVRASPADCSYPITKIFSLSLPFRWFCVFGDSCYSRLPKTNLQSQVGPACLNPFFSFYFLPAPSLSNSHAVPFPLRPNLSLAHATWRDSPSREAAPPLPSLCSSDCQRRPSFLLRSTPGEGPSVLGEVDLRFHAAATKAAPMARRCTTGALHPAMARRRVR